MKKLVLFTFACILALTALNSCCKLCTIDYSRIDFHGYTALEMDSVSIVTYEANTDNMVDSIHAFISVEGEDKFSYRMTENLRSEYDYEIIIFRTKQTFDITNLTIDTRECNCDEAEYLKSYVIDGETKEGNIAIYK